jgi:hypothetical protein
MTTPDTDSTVISDLAQRYRISEGAVRAMLDAVIRGGGTMAQFSHPEFGGTGQWMRGGMTMVGDMFNRGLQSTVSGLASELANLMGTGGPLQAAAVSQATRSWWPPEWGAPASSGGQNDVQYAFFPRVRRLAIRRGGAIVAYDTGEHAIGGVQQQQGGVNTLQFTSQFGTFTVDRLPVVPDAPTPEQSAPPVDSVQPAGASAGGPAPAAAAATAPVPEAAAPAPPSVPAATPAPTAAAPDIPVPAAAGPVTPTRAVAHDAASTAAADRGSPASQRISTGDTTAPSVSSTHRPVDVASEPVLPPVPPTSSSMPDSTLSVSNASIAAARTPIGPRPVAVGPAAGRASMAEIISAIEGLGALKDKGLLSDAEFADKKADLLRRL